MKIVVFGGKSLLGQCLKKVAKERGIDKLFFLDIEEDYIVHRRLSSDLLAIYQSDYVINCTAYTAVEKIEDEIELAHIRSKTAATVAKTSTLLHKSLLQGHTNFGYQSTYPRATQKEKSTDRVHDHGLIKLIGNWVVVATTTDYFILRAHWLYSTYADNFLKTMLRLGAKRQETEINMDPTNCPPCAIDLAECICDVIQSGSKSFTLYHYSDTGVVSQYDFTNTIV